MQYITDDDLPDEVPEPGCRNILAYCDESGIDGQRYYGFGSLATCPGRGSRNDDVLAQQKCI